MVKRSNFLIRSISSTGVLQGGRMRYYEMPGYSDVDIDYPHDWKPAEQRVLKYGYQGKKNRLGIKAVVIDADDVLFDSQVSENVSAMCICSCLNARIIRRTMRFFLSLKPSLFRSA